MFNTMALQKVVYAESNIYFLNTVLLNIRKRFQHVYLVLSPPRCSSTAFARVFWENTSIGYYSHEPFDIIYHSKYSLLNVLQTLLHPIKLTNFKSNITIDDYLLIKDITFQVNQYFPILLSLINTPVIFLIRDPRLCISSRMYKLYEGNQDPLFSCDQSGWFSLISQINQCKLFKIPYLIVDSSDFRNSPQTIFKAVFEKSQLPFSYSFFRWNSIPNLNLGNLCPKQDHWYGRVLLSTGVQEAMEFIPQIESFPTRCGLRAHVKVCLDIYSSLLTDKARILP